MLLTGIARIGRDAELRYTPSGEKVINLAAAFNYGKKDAQGNRPVQWLDASLWGDRAEALKPHLLKGTAVSITLADPHIEVFTRKDNTRGEKLVGRIIDLEFAGGKAAAPASAPAPAAPSTATPAPSAPAAGGFNDFEDVPF